MQGLSQCTGFGESPSWLFLSPIPRLPFSSYSLSDCSSWSPFLPLLPHSPPQAILHIVLSARTRRELYTFHSLSRFILSLRKAKWKRDYILGISLYNKQTNKKTYWLFVEKSFLSLPQSIMCFKTFVQWPLGPQGFVKYRKVESLKVAFTPVNDHLT